MTAVCRLAAILCVDVVGYSRLIGADEAAMRQSVRAVTCKTFWAALGKPCPYSPVAQARRRLGRRR
jgi:hypothetical protein